MSREAQLAPAGAGAASRAEETAAGLRAAIRAEDYEAAGRLMVQLTETVAAQAELRPPEEFGHDLAEAMGLLLWAKRAIVANRAHLQARLNQAGQAARYQAFRGTDRSRTWTLRG